MEEMSVSKDSAIGALVACSQLDAAQTLETSVDYRLMDLGESGGLLVTVNLNWGWIGGPTNPEPELNVFPLTSEHLDEIRETWRLFLQLELAKRRNGESVAASATV